MVGNLNWIKLHVEMDYDNYILDGVDKNEAIRRIAKDWHMSQEEVNDIVAIYEKELTDIDKTGDLGDII